MLSKVHMLAKENDFSAVFKDGKGVRGTFLLMKVLKGSAQSSRFGFVISKKVSNKAVDRNKIKRQLKSVVVKYLANMREVVDVVFVAKPEILGKSFDEIRSEVEVLLKKSKIV